MLKTHWIKSTCSNSKGEKFQSQIYLFRNSFLSLVFKEISYLIKLQLQLFITYSVKECMESRRWVIGFGVYWSMMVSVNLKKKIAKIRSAHLGIHKSLFLSKKKTRLCTYQWLFLEILSSRSWNCDKVEWWWSVVDNWLLLFLFRLWWR